MVSLGVKTVLMYLAILSATAITLAIGGKPTRHASKELVQESILKRSDSLNNLAKPYQFGYQIKDKDGNMQHRHEESDANGVKRGSYGYVDANGVYRKVFYVADKNGFRIKEMKSNEPGFDAKVATEAIKETSKLKPIESPPLAAADSPYHSSGQLSPSLLPTASNYHTSPGGTSLIANSKLHLSDRDLNNQLVKASFNLNTSESKKDSSKTTKSRSVVSTPTNYESINGKISGNLVSHSLLPDSIKANNAYPSYPNHPGQGLIGNVNFVKDIGSSSDNRREFAEEPYVYYAHPPAGEAVNHGLNSNSVASTLAPVRPIDASFPYPFVSPRTPNGYQTSDNVLNGNSLQSSHSIPIYSQLNAGKSPYLQPMPIHTYRAPTNNTSGYGVNYSPNSPKTVYVPVYPPIIPNTIYSNEPGYTVTPYSPPFESTRLRPPEPTSPTTLGYMHPLQPVRSATTPAYGTSPAKYHNYNSPPLENSIERPTGNHKHPIDHGYNNGYPGPAYPPYINPPYSSGGPTQSPPPYNPYLMKPLPNGGGNSIDPPPHSSSSLSRPLQYLDGPGPGSMIGNNRMQPTVFYVSDAGNPDSLLKKQNSIDPDGLPYGPAPHRTGHNPHDPTPHGFESPFIDMPPTPPPVPPPEQDNNQGHASSSGPQGSPPDAPPEHGHPGHHNPYGAAPPSPPGHPLDAHHHASNPYYNPNYNPYGPAAANSPGMTSIPSDPARARLASYYQAIRQAAPPSSSSPLSASPSAATSTSSSSPSTSNVPSVLLGIQSAHGLEVATSLGSLSDADANYNPSHYPTPDQLSKWKAKVRSNFRRNRNRNRANSLSTDDDDSDDDSVVSSSSDIELKRIHSLDSNDRRSILNQRLNLNYNRNSLLVQLSGQSNSSTTTTPPSATSHGVRWPGGLR